MLKYAAMHIVVNGTFWPQAYVGSGQYLHNLISHTQAHAPEHRWSVIVPRRLHPQRLNHNNVQIIPMATPFDRRSARLATLWFEQVSINQACRSLRADLLHVPYTGAPLTPALPMVITVHDLIPLLLPAYRTSRAMRWYMQAMKWSLRRADRLLAVSEFTKANIERVLGVPGHKIVVTYQGVGAGYRPQPQAAIAAIRERSHINAPYIYYIGGFDVRKNVTTALRAFAQVRRQHNERVLCVIGGKLPTERRALFPDIHKIILEERIASDVVLLGAVSEADNAALMSGCRAFVFPSDYEGFGLPPLEAMRCGAPVLASATTSVGEVVGDGGLLLPPNDVDAWTQALVRVLSDQDLRSDLGQRGLARAQTFDWNTTAQKTLAAYAQAMTQA